MQCAKKASKVFEEAPCPTMTPQLREKMGQGAILAAQALTTSGQVQ